MDEFDFSADINDDEDAIIDTDVDELAGVEIEEAPDGGTRAWLIVLSCFGINLIVGTMTSLIDISTNDVNITKELDFDTTEVQKASNYFKSLSDLFAPFAILVMIKFGYKVTVVVGSLIVCFSFTNMSMLGGGSERSIGGYWQFWLCGPAAIGVNFLKIGALIPILEYFNTKRMKALTLSRLGSSLGGMATMGLVFAGGIKWRTVFRINAGLCILTLLIAFTLRNIGIKHKHNHDNDRKPERKSIFKRIIDIFDVPVFKNKTFWIIMGVFFFFKFGLTPTALTLPTVSSKISDTDEPVSATDSFAGILGANVGSVGGMGSAYLFKRLKCMKRFTKKSLMFVLTMVAISGPIIGICSVITPKDFGFYIFLNLVVTVFQYLSENMRDESIPTVFGRSNIRITESCLNMFVGIAGMIAGAIQQAVDKANNGWKINLRLGGSFLLMVGIATAALVILHKLQIFKLKEKAGARRTSASKKSNDNRPPEDQFPKDIDEISMTDTSGKMQTINHSNEVEQRNEPMRRANTDSTFHDARYRDAFASSDERMQQAYGMNKQTRHLSMNNFSENSNHQMQPYARMNRSYSASGMENTHHTYDQYPAHSFYQNVQGHHQFQENQQPAQGHFAFQGSNQYITRGNPFQGNIQVMHGHYPDQRNMQGPYPIQGSRGGPPVQERSKRKHDKNHKRGKSPPQQHYPFHGKRQPIPSNNPNKTNRIPDNYVAEQITDAGTVLY